jgi:uncharacterized Zn finger protein (UPF0148 family)
MQPEISLRCWSCGASVREPAMFCPECGKPLANSSREAELPAAAEVSKAALAQSAPTSVEPAVTAADPATSASKAHQPDESGSRHSTRERTRERLHRASHAARGALEDNVERIHHVSTAMFEEASYDPSLRFVLVALGLFVVFVILLVLSKVMG